MQTYNNKISSVDRETLMNGIMALSLQAYLSNSETHGWFGLQNKQ